jgi:hypothetical protein
MSFSDAEVTALTSAWLARTYRQEAQKSRSVRDIYRLCGMASSWKFAVRELCDSAGIRPNDEQHVVNAEADRAESQTDIQLARDSKGSKL